MSTAMCKHNVSRSKATNITDMCPNAYPQTYPQFVQKQSHMSIWGLSKPSPGGRKTNLPEVERRISRRSENHVSEMVEN
eukprot:14577142-Heterocapsa_arctica.AAC.1